MICFISAPISKADPQKQTEAYKIQAAWSQWSHFPSEAELKRAAELAQEGYLSSVKFMKIINKRVSKIPSDNIGKLVSLVTDTVFIANMTKKIEHWIDIDNKNAFRQLDAILANVQSEVLRLEYMWLNEENTRALVTAMRTRVQSVELYDITTLDPELLSAYDGQGRCTGLALYGEDTRRSYGARLKRWAGDRGWTVTQDNSVRLVLKRQ